MKHLNDEGVEVINREGTITYLPRVGGPGQLIIDPNASIGALQLEYRHFLDVKEAGFPGIRPYIEDPNEMWRLSIMLIWKK
jgi:hypothetical protein